MHKLSVNTKGDNIGIVIYNKIDIRFIGTDIGFIVPNTYTHQLRCLSARVQLEQP